MSVRAPVSWILALLAAGPTLLACRGDKGDSGACPRGETRAADGLCYPAGDSGGAPVGGLDLGLVQSLSPMSDPPDSPTNRVANDAAAALLGQRLFFDAGLSPDGTQSCASCHLPERDLSGAVAALEGDLPRLPPPLVGAAWRDWFGWTGSCDTAWCAAATALEHADQLDGDRLSLAHHISEDSVLKTEYEAVFGDLPDLTGLPERARPSGGLSAEWDGLSAETQAALTTVLANVGKSWEAWMRQLRPGESALDRYVVALSQGDTAGGGHLSDSALRGLILFTGDGSCVRCHRGPLLSGDFANIGLGTGAGSSEPDRAEGLATALVSEFNGAGAWSDDPTAGAEKLFLAEEAGVSAGTVRVPALRTLARTAPHMHDGRFADLDAVLAYYNTLPDTPAIGQRDPELAPLTATEAALTDLAAVLDAVAGAPPDAALLQAP